MREAELYDFDGVVIPGAHPFRFDIVLKHFRQSPLLFTPPPIVPLTWEVAETYRMSPREALNFVTQSMRSVSLDTWEYLWNRDADVFGNTGRPNKRPWVDMTERTLHRGAVLPRFEHIFFRPLGVNGIQSKGAAIKELEKYYHVTHYDDDPWVTFGLARLFPDVSFVLVQELSSGILMSQEEMERFPNVRRIARLSHVASKYA